MAGGILSVTVSSDFGTFVTSIMQVVIASVPVWTLWLQWTLLSML